MRLLDTTTFELRLDSHEFFQGEGYAILSHRWSGAEITFDEIARHAPSLREKKAAAAAAHKDGGGGQQQRMMTKSSPQLDKIRGACEVARAQGPAVAVVRQLLHQQGERDRGGRVHQLRVQLVPRRRRRTGSGGCGNVTVDGGGPAIFRPARSFAATKYEIILLLSPLLLIGAVPVWIYVTKKLRKKAEKGIPFVLQLLA
ncbi:hypothetical protein diail_11721 [Diaporthe ilicicola]|nr:hypothetical protein diail_11721 [Diaporthe ilicicola]